MRITKLLLVTLYLLLVIAVSSCRLHTDEQSQSRQIKVITFRTGSGWGYNVMLDSNVYIHQEFIPVIHGNRPFPDEQSAKSTGELVVQKITSGKSPTITADDLVSLGVIDEEDTQR